MAAGTLDLRADLDRIYLAAFEKRGGLEALFAAVATVRDWDLDLSDRLYEIYLSHVRHVVAARRDIAYFRMLSEHILRVRDVLKRSNPSLARRISVLEDMVDEALAALPSADRPERSRKHVVEILKSLHGSGSISRAALRRRHGLGDANTSRILREMEEEGLIARWQCGRDVTVGITALGREEVALQFEGLVPGVPHFDLDIDNGPDTLANYVLARLSPTRLADQADEAYPVQFGRDLGATLARYCGSAEEGERKFNEVWARLLQSPLASLDQESGGESRAHGRFRLAIMSLLQFWAREAADTNALLVRRKCEGSKKTLLVVVLDLGQGHWAKALKTAEALRDALEAAAMSPHILLIGVSGYHEERIIGKLASDIFLLQCGYDGLQLASSPWASDGTVEGLNERFGHSIGSADIRLVNAVSLPPDDPTIRNREPIFRHLGYRAFANQSWLLKQRHAKTTPTTVCEWIDGCLAGEPDLSPETLPQRAWLCLKGGPVNYPHTEFPAMLDYLRRRCGAVGLPGISALATGDPDPDDIFEKFIRGASPVLISGSIHDLLLEEYWTGHGRGFAKLLDKDDFADWFRSSNVGLNYIKFSDRLPDHIETLVHELYAEVLAATVKIANLKQADSARALFAYVATILAPSHRENWNTEATDTRWSFAANLESIGRLLLEELEPCGTKPKRPELRVVRSA